MSLEETDAQGTRKGCGLGQGWLSTVVLQNGAVNEIRNVSYESLGNSRQGSNYGDQNCYELSNFSWDAMQKSALYWKVSHFKGFDSSF